MVNAPTPFHAEMVRDNGKIIYSILAIVVPDTSGSYSENFPNSVTYPEVEGSAVEIATATTSFTEGSSITGGFALSKKEAENLVNLLKYTYNI